MIMTSWSAPIEDFMKAVSSIHFPWISLLEKKLILPYHIRHRERNPSMIETLPVVLNQNAFFQFSF